MANARNNRRNVQPAPSVETPETINTEEAKTVTISGPLDHARPVNAFDLVDVLDNKKAAEKASLLSATKQGLGYVADLYREGSDKAKLAETEANAFMLSLYQGLASGLLVQAEVSAILVDVFGPASMKKDGSPSKTPGGRGAEIQKRIKRIVDANNRANMGKDYSDWIEPVTADDLAPVVAPFNAPLERDADGNAVNVPSFWAAYDRIAEIRAASVEKADAAFNPRSILNMVAKLTDNPEATVERFNASKPLLEAYAALSKTIRLIGEELAKAEPEANETPAG